MTNQINTLGDAFPQQLARVRELLTMYQALPIQSGWFGVAALKNVIDRAERAQADGDVVAMLRLYEEMKECE